MIPDKGNLDSYVIMHLVSGILHMKKPCPREKLREAGPFN